MNAVATTTDRPKNPIVAFKESLDVRMPQFAAALPAHIPPERFARVVLTAVQNNADLLNCDRQSLWNAAMRAAQDGLLPDGREGAIVKFSNQAQWMPMVFGILKKVRNSGELKSITARLVYAGDEFRYWVDETGEHIRFEPADAPDKNTFRRAFAVAITKDGGSYIEVMDAAEIEKVRNVSRAKNNGPWKDWWEEMVKKTVIRRLSKRLPMSNDLDDLIRRDDDLYAFGEQKEQENALHRPAQVSALQAFARAADAQVEDVHEEQTEQAPAIDDATGRTVAEPAGQPNPKTAPKAQPETIAEDAAAALKAIADEKLEESTAAYEEWFDGLTPAQQAVLRRQG